MDDTEIVMSSDSDPIERLVRLMHERWGGDDLSDDENRLAAEEWAATEHPTLVIEREKWERRARAALAALREGKQ